MSGTFPMHRTFDALLGTLLAFDVYKHPVPFGVWRAKTLLQISRFFSRLQTSEPHRRTLDELEPHIFEAHAIFVLRLLLNALPARIEYLQRSRFYCVLYLMDIVTIGTSRRQVEVCCDVCMFKYVNFAPFVKTRRRPQKSQNWQEPITCMPLNSTACVRACLPGCLGDVSRYEVWSCVSRVCVTLSFFLFFHGTDVIIERTKYV